MRVEDKPIARDLLAQLYADPDSFLAMPPTQATLDAAREAFAGGGTGQALWLHDCGVALMLLDRLAEAWSLE